MRRRVAFAFCSALSLCAASASAQTPLSLEDVQDLARRQNPGVVLARARKLEAAGRLTTARSTLAANPDLDAFVGRRGPAGDPTMDLEASAVQRFEIAGQRGLRIRAAGAGVDRESAAIEATSADAVAEATRAFYVLLHAQHAEALARSAESVASGMLDAARVRYEAGEVPILDVNVARIELARTRQNTFGATADRERALGNLRAIVAMTDERATAATGAWEMEAGGDLTALLDAALARPEIRGLAAEVAAAEAEWQLARTRSTPDLVGGLGVKREEGRTAVGARVGLSIPLFRRSAGDVAAAEARLQAARAALTAERTIARGRVRSLHAVHLAARRAADVFGAEAIPSLEENDRLARESYEAGRIGLIEYLIVRREGVAARQQQLGAELAATLAAIDLRAASGLIR